MRGLPILFNGDMVRAYIVRNSFYFGNSYARDPLGTV